MVNSESPTALDTASASLADLIEPAAGGGVQAVGLDGGQSAALLDPMYLDLGDLLPDQAGEVVLMGDGDLPFSIHASVPVTAAGIADAHITASGVDVTGQHFYSFEGGITLYSPTNLVIDTTHDAS